MKLFSMNWFKSEKEKELESLKIEEQKLKIEILQKQLVEPQKVETLKQPFKNLKLVGDNLIIVLENGDILTKSGATEADFKKAIAAKTEKELLELVVSKEVKQEIIKEEQEFKAIEKAYNGLEILKTSDEFEVKDGSVYLKGIERSIPALLVEKFAEIAKKYPSDANMKFEYSDEYRSLKKFWLKCCLNPNAQSAEDLYGFLSHHQFKIDKHGNFYAYRRVQSVGDGNKVLVDFVSNAYNKIKAVWKKKPVDYAVYEGSEGFYLWKIAQTLDPKNDGKYCAGNLEVLFKNISGLTENRYTSKHTGKEDYRVGEVISMPRNEGDDDNSISCSYGFHAASKMYDYSGFGDVPILMIVNPMDVLAVPRGEVGKLRTCRWYFAMTLPEEEKYILDDKDFDVTDLGDVFEEKCGGNLEEYVKNSFAEEVKRHTFTLPAISGKEITKIVISLDEMKEKLANRVNIVVD